MALRVFVGRGGKGRVVVDGMNDDLLTGNWLGGLSRGWACRRQPEIETESRP